MTLAVGAFYVFSATTFFGAVLVAVFWFRGAALAERARKFGDLHAKGMVEVLLWLSGIAALGGKYISGSDSGWGWAVGASSLSTLAWKLVQMQLDGQLRELDKLAKAAEDESAARATEIVDGQSYLIGGVRSGVEFRLNQILDALASSSKPPTLARVQETLAPRSAIRDQLERLASVLQGRSPASRPKPNIRVGLYLRRLDHMVPVAGVDLRNVGYNPFTSYQAHQSAYACTSGKQSSHVVQCMLRRSMIIVESCIEAAERAEFWFSHEAQKSYLRSLVVYHLGEVVDQGGASVHAVIAADSDSEGVFSESRRDMLEEALQEFGLRVRLEMALQEFLARGRG